MPWHGGTGCNGALAYINEVLNDFALFKTKIKRFFSFPNMNRKNWKNNTDWCGGTFLHMLDPPGPRTALWSIPGSGNYWIRYLIQKTTGYMTGTNLKEYDKPGYPAGHIANGSVIVIKDHLVYIKDYILYVSRNYHKTKFKLWQPPYVKI